MCVRLQGLSPFRALVTAEREPRPSGPGRRKRSGEPAISSLLSAEPRTPSRKLPPRLGAPSLCREAPRPQVRGPRACGSDAGGAPAPALAMLLTFGRVRPEAGPPTILDLCRPRPSPGRGLASATNPKQAPRTRNGPPGAGRPGLVSVRSGWRMEASPPAHTPQFPSGRFVGWVKTESVTRAASACCSESSRRPDNVALSRPPCRSGETEAEACAWHGSREHWSWGAGS